MRCIAVEHLTELSDAAFGAQVGAQCRQHRHHFFSRSALAVDRDDGVGVKPE